MVDTAPAYTHKGEISHNEEMIERLIGDRIRDGSVALSTKCGHGRDPVTGDSWIDGRPETIVLQCESSLRVFGLEQIPLYSLHWPDPNVPLDESLGTLDRLRREGKVGLIGLCNGDIDQVRSAIDRFAIDFVQNRLSVLDRATLPILALCLERGVDFYAYSPLGGRNAESLNDQVDLARIASRHQVSPHRLALSWLLASGATPIVGASRPETARDAFAARDLVLTSEERDSI